MIDARRAAAAARAERVIFAPRYKATPSDDMEYEEATVDYATWKRHLVIHRVVGAFSVRTKRRIYQFIRRFDAIVDEDCVLTDYGVTCGEFAIFSLLAQPSERTKAVGA